MPDNFPPNDEFPPSDDFDYDYYGPNYNGYYGHGFDDNPDDSPYDSSMSHDLPEGMETEGDAQEFDPPQPKMTLAELQEKEPIVFNDVMDKICIFAHNRHFRLLRKIGESPGLEKCLEAIEDDFNSGYSMLGPALVNGTLVICLWDFNVYTNSYDLCLDSWSPA